MQPERIQELFEKMRETNRGVDTFIMSALLNGMIGRSLEAVIPVLERAHGLLSGNSLPISWAVTWR